MTCLFPFEDSLFQSMRFQLLTVVLLKIYVIWDVMQCQQVNTVVATIVVIFFLD